MKEEYITHYTSADAARTERIKGIQDQPSDWVVAQNERGILQLLDILLSYLLAQTKARDIQAELSEEGLLFLKTEDACWPISTADKAFQEIAALLYSEEEPEEQSFLVINALSERLGLSTLLGDTLYEQQYSMGNLHFNMRLNAQEDLDYGTRLIFSPSRLLFRGAHLHVALLRSYFQRKVCFTPNLRIQFKTLERQPRSWSFHAPNGIADYLEILQSTQLPMVPPIRFEVEVEEVNLYMEVALAYTEPDLMQAPPQLLLGYANGWETPGGGDHVDTTIKALEGFWTSMLDDLVPNRNFSEKYELDLHKGLLLIVRLEGDPALIGMRNGRMQFTDSIFTEYLLRLIGAELWEVFEERLRWKERILRHVYQLSDKEWRTIYYYIHEEEEKLALERRAEGRDEIEQHEAAMRLRAAHRSEENTEPEEEEDDEDDDEL